MDTRVFFNVKKLNTPGDYMKRPYNRRITRRPYREFEYMPQLQKQNPITKILKNLRECFKELCNIIKQSKPKHFDIDAKSAKGTTTQI